MTETGNFDVNTTNDLGYTALHIAVLEGKFEEVKSLLAEPAIKVNLKNKIGSTALHKAAEQGNPSMVALLLTHPEIDVNALDTFHGWTALSVAASKNHVMVIQELIKHPKIDPNASNEYGWTPLHWAAQYGHHAAVYQLLEAPGINPNLMQCGKTAFCVAAENGHTEVVRALLLMWNGLYLHAATRFAMSPLQMAVINNHIPVVEMLLAEPEMSVDMTDCYGNTLLQLALGKKLFAMAVLLQNYGAQWPLQLACVTSTPEPIIHHKKCKDGMNQSQTMEPHQLVLSEEPLDKELLAALNDIKLKESGKERLDAPKNLKKRRASTD